MARLYGKPSFGPQGVSSKKILFDNGTPLFSSQFNDDNIPAMSEIVLFFVLIPLPPRLFAFSMSASCLCLFWTSQVLTASEVIFLFSP
jgi:hypothetical protein